MLCMCGLKSWPGIFYHKALFWISNPDECAGSERVKFMIIAMLLVSADCVNRCGICRQTTDQHLLAKCDSCHKHYHLGCLDPPLTRMPKKTKLMGWLAITHLCFAHILIWLCFLLVLWGFFLLLSLTVYFMAEVPFKNIKLRGAFSPSKSPWPSSWLMGARRLTIFLSGGITSKRLWNAALCEWRRDLIIV